MEAWCFLHENVRTYLYTQILEIRGDSDDKCVHLVEETSQACQK